VIDILGELKIQTIFAAQSSKPEVLSSVASQFFSFLKESSMTSMFNKSILFRTAHILFLETASSTKTVAWTGVLSDPAVLARLKLLGYARNILHLLGQTDLILLLDSVSGKETLTPDPVTEGEGIFSHAKIQNPQGVYAGKLSTKKEPAGKIRVFAMVTVWDQMVLKPIHDMCFAFLKGLPNDGTFDQHRSELRARSKALLAGRSYGYDLTAATDRLPVFLQAMILNLIIPELGNNWSLLLTRRQYYLYIPSELYGSFGIPKGRVEQERLLKRGGKVPNVLTFAGVDVPVMYDSEGKPYVVLNYSVGQPMGALSSWAMLAVTHHFLVQFAYRRAYKVPMSLPFTADTWYTGYELLGDDIILFDQLVAQEYLILLDEIGVPINTTKSVVATVPVTEFAKVTSHLGNNVSALS